MSEVHHQGVEVAGSPPLRSEGQHRDVPLPLLDARTVAGAGAGAAPASLVVTRDPEGEPGGGPSAIPVNLPAPGRAGDVCVVTSDAGSVGAARRLTGAHIQILELKLCIISYHTYCLSGIKLNIC